MTTTTAPMTIPRIAARPSAFRQLAATNWREMIREPKTLFFTMIFPFIFLAMFSAMGILIDRGGDPPVVAVAGAAPSVTSALHDAGIATADTNAANVTVTVAGQSAVVTLAEGANVSKDAVVTALRDTGISRSDIAVVYADGSPVFDPLKGALPTVVMLGLLSLALLGTAAPLVGLRGRGTLRLLGTTPVRRWTFILSQTPCRVALGALQMTIIAGYAWYLGYLEAAAIPALLVTVLLGLSMLLALAYLFASRMVSQDLATTIASLLLPVAMLFAGSMVPKQLMPAAVQQIADYLPTTLLSQAVGISLVGDGSAGSLPIKWALMGLTALIATALAAKLFTWDQGDAR